jgi:hypothetical protein
MHEKPTISGSLEFVAKMWQDRKYFLRHECYHIRYVHSARNQLKKSETGHNQKFARYRCEIV